MRACDLASPISHTLWMTQSLSEAAARLADDSEAVVVVNFSSQPIGVITEADLKDIAAREPNSWTWKRCACLVPELRRWVRPDASLTDILAWYQREQVWPLLVFDGQRAGGIIYPSTVFQWCAEHDPEAWESLGHGTEAASES